MSVPKLLVGAGPANIGFSIPPVLYKQALGLAVGPLFAEAKSIRPE